MTRLLAVAVLGLAAASLVSACESTQSKSARIGREARKVATGYGLRVTRVNREVEVISTSVLKDANGTAAVVELRNRSRKTLAALPLAIDVTGAGGKSLFRNDAPGLQPSLVQAALIPPGGRLVWVDDQVQAAATPRSVRAKVGMPARPAPSRTPRIDLSKPRLSSDPVSGVAAVGKIANRSKIDQRRIVVFAVARRGGNVVAAGRAQIERLKAGKRASFKVFFIGNPKGARISLSAPPTTFE